MKILSFMLNGHDFLTNVLISFSSSSSFLIVLIYTANRNLVNLAHINVVEILQIPHFLH